MPAAAVIPALIAYIKVVAVKKLVVGFWALCFAAGPVQTGTGCGGLLSGSGAGSFAGRRGASRTFTLNKLECLKQAIALNTLAWNSRIGLWFYFVGSKSQSND